MVLGDPVGKGHSTCSPKRGHSPQVENHCPKGFMTFQNQARWGPRIEAPEPVGDITYLSHKCVSEMGNVAVHGTISYVEVLSGGSLSYPSPRIFHSVFIRPDGKLEQAPKTQTETKRFFVKDVS